MRRPDLGGSQAECIQVHHALDLRPLFGTEFPGVELRSHQSQLFPCEANEDKGMVPGLVIQAVQKAWEQAGAAPVVHNSVPRVHLVEMGSNQNDVIALSGEHADQIGNNLLLHQLLRHLLRITPRLQEQLLEHRFSLVVLSGERFEPCLKNRLIQLAEFQLALRANGRYEPNEQSRNVGELEFGRRGSQSAAEYHGATWAIRHPSFILLERLNLQADLATAAFESRLRAPFHSQEQEAQRVVRRPETFI